MNSLNHSFVPSIHTAFQQSGRLANLLPDGSFVVESAGRGWHCRKAASCLLDPEYEDTVLIAGNDDGQVWLLAVLERAQAEAAALISLPGDLCIATPQGSLNLQSKTQLQLESNTFSLQAEDATCQLKKLGFSAAEVSSWVGIGRWMGRRSESLWENITQISQHLFRQTRHTEHVRAGQIDCQADRHLRMHAHNTVITSEAITKIDSEQIHVG